MCPSRVPGILGIFENLKPPLRIKIVLGSAGDLGVESADHVIEASPAQFLLETLVAFLSPFCSLSLLISCLISNKVPKGTLNSSVDLMMTEPW